MHAHIICKQKVPNTHLKHTHTPQPHAQEAVRTAALESPTLLVIGDVVALSPGWELYLHHGQSLQRPCVDWREHHHHQQGAEEQGVRLYGQEGGVLGVEGKLLDGALAVGEHML